jgi:hypothetical protein
MTNLSICLSDYFSNIIQVAYAKCSNNRIGQSLRYRLAHSNFFEICCGGILG